MKRTGVIVALVAMLGMSGCLPLPIQSLPPQAEPKTGRAAYRDEWEDWYMEVSYGDYMSDDYPYNQTLMKISGEIVDFREYEDVLFGNEESENYIVSIRDDRGDVWGCRYGVNLYGFRAPEQWEPDLHQMEIAPAPLDIGEMITVYAYHSKKYYVTDDNQPEVSINRLMYQGVLYHCVDEIGGMAVRTNEPLLFAPEEATGDKTPCDFTMHEYIERFNTVAEENDIAARLDWEMRNVDSWAPNFYTVYVANTYVSTSVSDRVHAVSFDLNESGNVVEIFISYPFGQSSWNKLRDEQREVALDGFAVAVMAMDPTLTLDDAKDIVEETQAGSAKKGKAKVHNGIAYTGDPDPVSHRIEMKRTSEEE